MSRKDYMRLAFALAKKGLNNTGSNPMVGAVLVKNGLIIGKGYHVEFGGLHAEANAIKDAERKGFSVKNAKLFVTLEPCSHVKKKTPPCSHLIVEKGIKEVFIGMKDPNKKVNGKGIRFLKKYNIKTTVLDYKIENEELNKGFISLMKTKRPYVTLKICSSMDGKIYNLENPKESIGDKIQLKHANKLRKNYDGILVGINTVLKDNPRLDYRGPKIKSYSQPRPIILDSKLRIPINSKVISENNKPIIFTQETSSKRKIEILMKLNCEIIIIKAMKPKEILLRLASLNLQRILIEGGGEIFSSFLASKFWNELIIYYSPKFLGRSGLALTQHLSNQFLVKNKYSITTKKIGRSLMLRIN